MKYMFVVAHPDDEVLGAGAFIHRALARGDEVCVVILNADYEKTRSEMFQDVHKSHEILGVKDRCLCSYKNMDFFSEDHRSIVETIESEIERFKPDYVFTHFDGDVHSDHKITSMLVQQAARLFQRHKSDCRIHGLYFMEIQSSTNWGAVGFKPDTYFEVSKEDVERKKSALLAYKNVVRPIPHPRSLEAIDALALLRGSEVGVEQAEAVMTCWRIEE